MQLTGCFSTSEQVRAKPSETGSFVVAKPLSAVLLTFVNTDNADANAGGAGVTKFVPGVSATVEARAVSALASQVLYTVDFQAEGDSTLVTYYIAGGIAGAEGSRAEMIDFANGRMPPPLL